MAESENDTELLKEILTDSISLLIKVDAFKVELKFSDPNSSSDAFVEIHPGAGGTESCDWAEMLLRMYQRWAEKKGFKTELIDLHKGEEAGIKSATILIKGENVYGWLKNESGVHRLVRISPFDSNARRHTSFASVWIYPELEDDIDIKIEEKDLKIDTYRASGAGGQHINKTDSAVRIRHIPTGIVVQSQNSRSQHQNKSFCLKMLQSRLYELEQQKKQAETDKENSAKTDIGWGNQIRSYVMQPYQMVKDLRNKIEESNIKAVLDGSIDKFLK